MKKKLIEVLNNIENYEKYGKSILLSGLTDNSRNVKKGYLFVALKGHTVDGHNFIDDAIEKGAVAIVGEIPSKKEWINKATYIKVNDSRNALGLIASAWFGNPSRNLKVIGVTGTDGKTTTSNFIFHILKEAGNKVGLISTISAKIGRKEYDTGFHVTNPDPIALQKFLAKMVTEKCEYAVLEVTSHGMDQGRVMGVNFEVAVLTNITREHLDYHKTWENYRDSKVKLFKLAKKCVVLNLDDKSCLFINKLVHKNKQVITYSVSNKNADIFAEDIKFLDNKSVFAVRFKDKLSENIKVESHNIGVYNVANTLAAVGVAKYYNVPARGIKKAVAAMYALEGRLENIPNKRDITIIVDFAHTSNALKEVLTLLKEQTKGRLISIFGCASERDDGKRPVMADISTTLADFSIFTAEDPRSEDINKILKEMASGVDPENAEELDTNSVKHIKKGKNYFMRIPERGEAIAFAIQKLALRNDTIVICGKGHEKSMSYYGIEYPWSDQEAVKTALKGKVKKINWKRR
jgi:UDP-N-acetylmuramoyl-L-alanyl-D-glutamate--2,6-diaminopimelate ligase